MRNIRRILALVMLCVAMSLGAGQLAAQEATPVVEPETLVLVERDENTELIDLGEPGASAGDILVFGPNPLYDAANETDTGATIVGTCIWLTADGHQQCTITFMFPDDSMVTAQGHQQEGAQSVMVITGGTGEYLNATGRLLSEPSDDGTIFTQTLEFGR